MSHSIAVLGTLPSSLLPSKEGHTDQEAQNSDPVERTPTIVQIQKTPIAATDVGDVQGVFGKIEAIGQNDIYYWLLGWLGENRKADVKITVVENATEVHIRKVSISILVVPDWR